jgi:chromosome segregation ATPase
MADTITETTEAMLKTLKADLEQTQKERERLKDALLSARSSVAEERAKASSLASKLSVLEKVVKDGRVEERVKERDLLRRQLGAAQSAAVKLEQLSAKKDEQLADAKKDVARIQRIVDGLQATTETMQSARNAAQEREKAALKRESEMAAKVGGLEESVKAAEGAIVFAAKEKETVDAEVKALRKALQTAGASKQEAPAAKA